MPDFQQSYRDRAAAFKLFVEPQKLPVRRAKFYEDCRRLNMVQPDKSVRLVDLLAYVKNELQVDPVNGQSLEEKDQAKEKASLEMRKLRAEVEAKEKASRKDDALWMEVVEHETQMAAFAGLVEESLRQITTIKLSELIYLCGGDVRRAAEFNQALENLYAAAMTEAVREQTRTIAFEDEEPDAEYGD